MNNKAKDLLKKYSEGQCTPEEIALIESWYLNYPLADNSDTLSLEELDETKAKIWATLPPVHQPVKLWPKYIRFAAAAIIILSVSVGIYFASQKTVADNVTAIVTKPIVPGGKKALLTLANGKSLVLSDAKNGKLADQTGTSIFKTANGEIVYNTDNSDKAIEVEYNQLTIPRGGYYTLTLADGTKVWLNSESSLKYPTDFVGNDRTVELTGEGYFEVAPRKNQPFKVLTAQQTVQVLGTHFNVNAYANEKATTTTLLEGSVKVSVASGANEKMLKPNQQASLSNGKITISEVNTEEAIAWVNNKFIFNNEELGSIMRQISRWYDVDVVCPPNLEKMAFFGNISRSKGINDVIKIMQKTEDVNFKIEGRRITVMQ